jgi:hypothetical protein
VRGRRGSVLPHWRPLDGPGHFGGPSRLPRSEALSRMYRSVPHGPPPACPLFCAHRASSLRAHLAAGQSPRPARTGRNGATSTSGCGRTSNGAVSESWAGPDTWPLRATGAAKTVSSGIVSPESVTLEGVTSKIGPSPPHRCTADRYTADGCPSDRCLSDPSTDDPSTDDSSTDDPFCSGRWSDRVGCRRAPGRRCPRPESDAPGGARRCGRPAPAGSG